MKRVHVIMPNDVQPYSPPNHTGTVNRRLIGKGSVASQNAEIVLGCISRGGEALPHTHEIQEQFIYILSGEGVISSGGEDQSLAPGSLAYIPAGVAHGIAALSEKLEMFIIYSPPLEKPETEKCERGKAW